MLPAPSPREVEDLLASWLLHAGLLRPALRTFHFPLLLAVAGILLGVAAGLLRVNADLLRSLVNSQFSRQQ